MPFWDDEYPHELHASVLLWENQIVRWKVGPSYWEDPTAISFRGEIPNLREVFDNGELSVQHKTFVVHDDEEHEAVFRKHAAKWFKQWKIHQNHRGGKPY